MWQSLRSDIKAIMARDPAAKSMLEVVRCYPSFHAVLIYRAAHFQKLDAAFRAGFSEQRRIVPPRQWCRWPGPRVPNRWPHLPYEPVRVKKV